MAGLGQEHKAKSLPFVCFPGSILEESPKEGCLRVFMWPVAYMVSNVIIQYM